MYERETCVTRRECGEWPDAHHLAVKFKEHNAPCLLRTLSHSSQLKLPFRVNNTSRTTFHILHSMVHGPLYNRHQILWSGFDIHRVYHQTGWYQSDTELFLTQDNRNQLASLQERFESVSLLCIFSLQILKKVFCFKRSNYECALPSGDEILCCFINCKKYLFIHFRFWRRNVIMESNWV